LAYRFVRLDERALKEFGEMRLLYVAVCLCLCGGVANARVLVVGIDGGSWSVIDPMIEAGELPHLEELIDLGASANLATVEPVTSPVVWTSIATGRSPAEHGVTDFFSTGATIATPSIYERLAVQGKRVGLYEVLMTWPPVPLPKGFVVPAWLRRDDTTWPPNALAGLDVFRTVYDGKPRNRDYLEQSWREGREKAASWEALAKRFDPEVGALTFFAADATSHRYWHSSFPEDFDGEQPAFEPDEENAVQRSMRDIDREIGKLVSGLDLAGEDSVLVVSDHGFQAHDEASDVWITAFEEVLEAHDLVPGRDGFTVVGTFFAVSLRIAPGPFAERDALVEQLTTLLRSYRTSAGEELFFVNTFDVAERPEGMERPWSDRLYQWVLSKGMSLLFDTKLDPTAHAMVVALPRTDLLDPLWPDGQIVVDGEKVALADAIHRQRFTGDHHPNAILIAAGGPIQRKLERGEKSVLDVAPLVAYLAGVPIADDLEGSLPTDWLEPERLLLQPAATVSASTLPRLTPEVERADAGSRAQDPELIEKLRALGYID